MKTYDYFLTFADFAFDIVVRHIVIALFNTPVREFASHCHAAVAPTYPSSTHQASSRICKNRAEIIDKR